MINESKITGEANIPEHLTLPCVFYQFILSNAIDPS